MLRFRLRKHRLPEIAAPAVEEPTIKAEACHHGGGPHGYRRELSPAERLLSECQAGNQVVIQRLLGGGPIRRRLLEMGMTPGSLLRIVKYAPLKDPIECEIKGYHIALRVAEARRIIVIPKTE
ncbi:MAG: FeoA family protein [bacterium]